MQSVFVIVTKLIASKNYFCKEFFVIILAAMVSSARKIGLLTNTNRHRYQEQARASYQAPVQAEAAAQKGVALAVGRQCMGIATQMNVK